MKYETLHAVIFELEEFEKHKSDSQISLDSFRRWLNERFYQQESPMNLMAKIKVDSPFGLNYEIVKQLMLLNRYNKIIIKKGMEKYPELVNEDFTYLYRLLDYESLTKIQLIEKNAHEKQSGLEVIKRLIKYGLVTEFPDPNDGRSKRIMVTEKGKELFKETTHEVNLISNIITARLSIEEKEMLFKIVKKMNVLQHNIYLKYREDDISMIESFISGPLQKDEDPIP